MMTPNIESYKEYLLSTNKKLSADHHKIKLAAFSKFEKIGFPHRKMENWRYTSVNKLLQNSFSIDVVNNTENLLQAIKKNQHINNLLATDSIIIINGSLASPLSSGVTIKNNAGIITEEHIEKASKHPLALLSLALTKTHCDIRINNSLRQPLHIFTAGNDTQQQDCIYKIKVEKNCNAEVILHHLSIGNSASFNSNVINIELAQDAKINLYHCQAMNNNAYLNNSIFVNQEKSTEFNYFGLEYGSQLSRVDLEIDFNQEHSQCGLYGLYITKGQQHIDHHNVVRHKARKCRSKEDFRGMLHDQSRAVFNGKIVFERDAQKSETQQINKNLLLSDSAEINTKPELEIYADDVKASHGATIGQLDKQAIYYMKTRGIDEESAKTLLLDGFANEFLQKLPNEQLQAYFMKQCGFKGEK